MSKALELFHNGMSDAESILTVYDCHNQNSNQIKEFYPNGMPNIDVLKRACVVMAFTAFESFFENLVTEINNKQVYDFSNEKRNKLLERFHNPMSKNIVELYKSWFGIENCLKTIGFDGQNAENICNRLDEYLKIRGQIVHVQKMDSSKEDVAKKENVTKILYFLKKFAENFDCFIEDGSWIEEARTSIAAN